MSSIPQEWLQHAPKPRELKKDENWNVFLSYRSVNRTWVLNLYDILVELDYKVFMDQFVLKPGDVLIDLLEDALGTSQSGVLIWSNAAEDSAWVRKEYNTMERKATTNKDFKFIPIKLDANELPEFAMNRIFMDFSSYPDGPNGGELLRLLHGIVGQPMLPETVRFAAEQDEAANEANEDVKSALRNGYPEDIIALSESDSLPWRTTPSLGCRAAESLIKLKKNADAVAILEKLEVRFPKAIRPKQLHALAVARLGADTKDPSALKQAQRILSKLYDTGGGDPETLGIYARTWMDRYALSNDANDLQQSRDYYAEAFKRAPDDYYTGVNAAAKSIFIGTQKAMDEGMTFAKQVEDLLQKRAEARANGETKAKEDYWERATAGEVLLMQKKYAEAGETYKDAIKLARTETGSHESTWKQACRLMEKLKPSDEEKTQVLSAFSHLPNYDTFKE